MSYDEFWERWSGSTAAPTECVQRRAKVDLREEHHLGVVIRRRWITFPHEINGVQVIVEMPDNAPTKSCDQGRHDQCGHRLGGPHEGGIILKLSLPGYRWRCGCPCHTDPHRAGRLF
ncbi:hypothetical protein [Mycobacterium asiaticum]|uniref:Uncharacterized protein n=1 Tax=Mycobacterium asiaticum TaxID=1790 RepID=A0A1A3KLM8_MYCAS|nr:hypothetical protein [Mycobacterium asiaticum]OBJ86077.1 hypothetical protein A5640_11245 [Mycobacterium asiaticum]